MVKKEVFKIQIKPTIKQVLAWKRLKDKTTRFILFGGAALGGKSWIGCEWLLIMCITCPGTKWFIGRNELKRIMKSTYITFLKVCKHHNIPDSYWKLNSQYNFIQFWNGSRIDLIDVAYKPADPLYERFGSEEYTGGWLEEAGEIKARAFDVLKSRIGRHMNDQYDIFPKMFLTCNPKKNWIYFDFYDLHKRGELPEDCCFIQSLYTDNPYAPNDYGEMLDRIKDPVMKARLKDGNWEYDDDEGAIMDYGKIIDIFSKPYNPDSEDLMYVSADPARFGRDKSVIILWHGLFIKKVWYEDKNTMPDIYKRTTTYTADKIKSKCDKNGAPYTHAVIDDMGLGGGVVDQVENCYAFVSAAAPITEFDDEKRYRLQETEKYSYRNLRAQCYFKLAELVDKGEIGCSSDIVPEVRNWIIQELEAVKKKNVYDNEKKLQIISKEEIKETIGRSPDFADAIMQRMVFLLGKPSGDSEVCIEW